MKIHIITVGSPKLSFAQDAFTEYTKRLGGFVDLVVTHVKEGKDTDKKILKVIGSSTCVLLDEHGKEYSSQQLAVFLDKKIQQSTGEMSFVIGGPDGHTGIIRERANHTWSLSQLTFPHDLAMVLLAETLYRSYSILNNHPYHRN